MRVGGVARAPVVVGRERELEALRNAVAAARAGEGSCTLLIGEAGVGKSRLLAEAIAHARRAGVAVLAGRAPIAAAAPFSAVAEALRSWMRGHPAPEALPPFDAGVQLVLPEWPAPPGTAGLETGQRRLLALEGVVRLVGELAQPHGAIVLVDDLHFADPESIEAFRYLAEAGLDGVAVVGAARPGETAMVDDLVRTLGHGPGTEVLTLTALDGQGVSDLVAALLDARAPQALVDDVVARTDGVPLLVEEMVRAHVGAGNVVGDGTQLIWRGGAAGVPATVRDLVGARLDAIAQRHRDVIVAGAVVGDFEPGLMTAAAQATDDVVADALREGVRIGLLETTGGAIAFRHAIIRDAALDATVPHQVAAIHRRVAAALAGARSSRDLERRAEHLAAVGDDDDAAGALAEAAGAALAEHAPVAAERSARRALERAGHASTRAAAADVLAAALAAQGRWLEALALDAATAGRDGDTPARQLRMATSALEAGKPELAEPIVARAMAADPSPHMTLVAGRVAVVRGDGAYARECARRVLEASPPPDVDTRLAALELDGRAADFLCERDAAEAAWARQAAEAEAAGRVQAQLRAAVHLGKVEIFAGRPPDRLHRAVALAREAGAVAELAWALENLGVGLAIHGDLPASIEVLDEAVGLCRQLRLDNLAYLLTHQAMGRSHVGGDCETGLDEAEALLPTDDLRLHSCSVRADIAMRAGQYDAATRWFVEVVDIMRRMPGVVPMDGPCWLVWALIGAGRRDDATAAIADARRMPDLERWYTRPVLLDAAEAVLAGDADGFNRILRDGAQSMPWDAALMREVAAAAFPAPARAAWLAEALEIYDRLGATIDADRVRAALRDAGGKVPRRRRPRQPVPAALAAAGVTGREFEVLRLLGEGLPNADIAARLYVSVRTVESHVSSLLTKLDARNRGQLIARSAAIRDP